MAVIDAWQGGGGRRARRAARAARARARAEGVERFVATLLAENRAMLRLFERLGPVTVRHRRGVLELEVGLPGRAGATAGPGAPRARA